MTIKPTSTLREEIREALVAGDALTSAELLPLCPSAQSTTDVSRAIYDLRQANLLTEAGKRPNQHPDKGSKQSLKAWRWTGPKEAPIPSVRRLRKGDAEIVQVVADTPEDEPVHHTPMEEIAEVMAIAGDRTDPTDLALSDLVDQADEALLALADSLLADNPLWGRLRTLANDAFNARCDYRLMRSLEESK